MYCKIIFFIDFKREPIAFEYKGYNNQVNIEKFNFRKLQ